MDKQLEMAGYKATYDSLLAAEKKGGGEHWIDLYPTNKKQEQEFTEWARAYLKKEMGWSEAKIDIEFGWWFLNYGLKIKNEKDRV